MIEEDRKSTGTSPKSVFQRIKRLILTTAAIILFVIGIPLLILPGPGILLLLLGFGLLALEYPWAKRITG